MANSNDDREFSPLTVGDLVAELLKLDQGMRLARYDGFGTFNAGIEFEARSLRKYLSDPTIGVLAADPVCRIRESEYSDPFAALVVW